MKSPKDRKYYNTDVVNTKDLLRVIQSIPSLKLVTICHQLKMKTLEIKKTKNTKECKNMAIAGEGCR